MSGKSPEHAAGRAASHEQALDGQNELLAEARRAHALLVSTFNAINDAIVVTDAAGRITQANDAVRRLFQRAPAEVIGDTCHSVLDESQGCPHLLLDDGEDATNEGVLERELLNRRHDRALNLRVSRVIDAASGAAGYIHVMRDITRERVLERHLMQAERMSLAGQMVSAVAHEVATPLSVVANIAEMLRMDAQPGSHQDDELRKITTQARRVTEMMRRLLNFVRQAPAQYAALDLGQLVGETVELLSYELRKARIEAQVEAASATPPVWGDRSQLQQVLLNLLTNAMQALGQAAIENGRIRIRISDSGPANVSLVVEDNGSGIAPDALERIFDYFFTTRIGAGGTGLGLAITRQIVEGHHGHITAENVGGGGARFIVTLPVAFPQHQRGG